MSELSDYLLSSAPDSDKIARCEAVLNDPDTPGYDVAKAQCHLIYRCIDGIYPRRKVRRALTRGVEGLSPELEVRWNLSLWIGQAYLSLLVDKDDSWRLYASAITRSEGAVLLWPPSVLNYLRAQAIGCYTLYLNDLDKHEIEARIKASINTWKCAIADHDFIKKPIRINEAFGDLEVLRKLAIIGNKIGMMPKAHIPITRRPDNHIFYKAFHGLGDGNPRAIW